MSMDILAFVTHLVATAEHLDHGKHAALDRAGAIVEKAAKDAIGTYAFGWPPLAPSTLAKKAADTPLLETGELRDSYGHRVGDDFVDVGSDNKKAVWHELGTPTIPPRSVLVSAAMQEEAEVVKVLGSPLTSAPMISRRQP